MLLNLLSQCCFKLFSVARLLMIISVHLSLSLSLSLSKLTHTHTHYHTCTHARRHARTAGAHTHTTDIRTHAPHIRAHTRHTHNTHTHTTHTHTHTHTHTLHNLSQLSVDSVSFLWWVGMVGFSCVAVYLYSSGLGCFSCFVFVFCSLEGRIVT